MSNTINDKEQVIVELQINTTNLATSTTAAMISTEATHIILTTSRATTSNVSMTTATNTRATTNNKGKITTARVTTNRTTANQTDRVVLL